MLLLQTCCMQETQELLLCRQLTAKAQSMMLLQFMKEPISSLMTDNSDDNDDDHDDDHDVGDYYDDIDKCSNDSV
jgi:hypothetical protein